MKPQNLTVAGNSKFLDMNDSKNIRNDEWSCHICNQNQPLSRIRNSAGQIGRIFTLETRAKISKKLSLEHRSKISEAKLNRKRGGLWPEFT